MKLTDKQVKAVRFIDKPIKIYDGGGLFLHTTQTAKTWRYSYRVGKRPREFTIGKYPLISLKAARQLHHDAKRLVLDGIDPVQVRKAKRAETAAYTMQLENDGITVRSVKDDWLEKKQSEWAHSTAKKNLLRIKNLPIPFLKKPITSVTPSDIMAVLEPIQSRGAIDLAHRVKNDLLKHIFDHAVRRDIITANPVLHPSVELKKRPPQTSLAHTTHPERLGAMIAGIDDYLGDRSTEHALRILPRVFTRPSQLLGAEWHEINFKERVWITPANKMKMRRDHAVPLSNQVLELFHEQREYTGDGNLVFPSRINGRQLSANTLNLALRRLGFGSDEITAHGFRHTASSLLNERKFNVDGKALRFSADAIERQLANVDSSVRGIYNRSAYMDERVIMMQAWSAYLDELKVGALA